MQSGLHTVLDCTLLSAWLLVLTQPWGQGSDSADLWLIRRRLEQSEEIFELKTRVFEAVRRALQAPDVATSPHVFDAINILLVVLTWVDGWDATPSHQDAALELAAKQIFASGAKRETFVDATPAEAFSLVLHKTVATEERPKCEQVIRMTLGLMRTSGYDFVSDITNGFREDITLQALRKHSQELTPEAYIARYGHISLAIGEVVSTIGPTLKNER